MSDLPKRDQSARRRKLQAAYAHAGCIDAKRALQQLGRELRRRNESVAASSAEGLEETLTMHRLGVFSARGASFKRTNLIESLMAGLAARRIVWIASARAIRNSAGAPLRS